MKKIIIMLTAALLGFGVSYADNGRSEKKSVTTVFTTDIDCPHCSKKILDTIPYERGVKDVQVDVPTKTVTVTYDPAKSSDEALTKAFTAIKVKVFGTARK